MTPLRDASGNTYTVTEVNDAHPWFRVEHRIYEGDHERYVTTHKEGCGGALRVQLAGQAETHICRRCGARWANTFGANSQLIRLEEYGGAGLPGFDPANRIQDAETDEE